MPLGVRAALAVALQRSAAASPGRARFGGRLEFWPGLRLRPGRARRDALHRPPRWSPRTARAGPAASRDALRAALAHGEAWLYYDACDPASGRVGNKAAFLRRGTLGRMPVLVGAGYIESHSSFAGP